MRLPEGIIADAEATFGELKFSAQRRANFARDEDNNLTDEMVGRTYDLKSKAQGMMIQVTIPADVGEKEIAYNAVVKLVNPVLYTVASASYGSRADVEWHVRADDIVPDTGAGKDKAEAAGTAQTAGAAQRTQNGGPEAGKDGKKEK